MPETEIEGRDAAGWKAQWDSLKHEIDALHPKLGELTAKLLAAEAALKLQEARAEQLDGENGFLSQQLGAANDYGAAQRQARESAETAAAAAGARAETAAIAAADRIAELTGSNSQLRTQIGACFDAVSVLHRVLGQTLDISH
jgi:hypothetical protein